MASPFDTSFGSNDDGSGGRIKPSRVLGADGMPYRSDAPEADFAVGHNLGFASLNSSGFRTYLHGQYDEAMRHSRLDAMAMRNDAFLRALLQERKLATASLPYRIEVDDERDPLQKAVQEGLLHVVRRVPNFRKMVMYLLDGIWFGRYGSQIKWCWEKMKLPDLRDPKKDSERKALAVRLHLPINGDKIGYHFDGTPYISINPAYASTIKNAEVSPTTAGATGLFLRGSWRWRYVIHTHEMEDADYFDSSAADAVHGVGIRSVLFWLDWLRKEWLSNIADWCERTGLGIRLWYYQGNNPESKKQVELAARESNDRTNIFIPRFGEGKGEGVEFVDTSSTGADLLLKLQAHIEEHQERFVIGQSLSGGRGAGDSLGGEGKAKLAKDTKSQIIQYDAGNIGESLTTDLLRVIQYWTYPEPEARAVNARLVFACEEPEPEKLLNAIKTFVLDLGGKVRMQEVQALIGLGGVQEGDDVISLESIHKQQPQPPATPGAPGAPGAPTPPDQKGPNAPQNGGAPSQESGEGDDEQESPSAGSDDYQPHGGHDDDDDDQEPGLEDLHAQHDDDEDEDQEPGSVGRWQRRLSPLRYAWEPHRHPRDLKGLFTKGMESHVIGETKHVGGLPVKRHGDDSYSVKTAKGWKKGTSDKIADHIVADHAKRREEGRSRINALKRTEGWTAPHESTHPVEAKAEAEGFAKLPKDARVVSLHPDTIGRMGTVVKDKKGVNAVKLDSTGEVVTGPFEPMKKVQSWRGKGMVAGPKAKKAPLGKLVVQELRSGEKTTIPDRPTNPQLEQKEFKSLKTALTRAVNTKDNDKIIAECDRALAIFEEKGYPDNWNNWERAKDDAQFAKQREGIGGLPESMRVDPEKVNARQSLLAQASGILGKSAEDLAHYSDAQLQEMMANAGKTPEAPKQDRTAILDKVFAKHYKDQLEDPRFKAMPKDKQDNSIAHVKDFMAQLATRIEDKDWKLADGGMFDTSNPAYRELFTELTGTKLPKTNKATAEAVRGHVGPPPEPTIPGGFKKGQQVWVNNEQWEVVGGHTIIMQGIAPVATGGKWAPLPGSASERIEQVELKSLKDSGVKFVKPEQIEKPFVIDEILSPDLRRERDKANALKKGDWVEYQDIDGNTLQGKIDYVVTKGKVIPGAGVQPPTKEYVVVDADGNAMPSAKEGTTPKAIEKPASGANSSPIIETEGQVQHDDELESSSGRGEGGRVLPQSDGGSTGGAHSGALPGAGPGDGPGTAGLSGGEDSGSPGLAGEVDRPGDGAVGGAGSGDGAAVAATAGRAGRLGGRGGKRSGRNGGRSVADPSPVEAAVSKPATKENPTDVAAPNFRYTSDDFFKGGPKKKFAANMLAIQTLKQIEREGRTTASPEEQAVLSRYVGWGQFPAVFNDYYSDKTPPEEREALRETLTPEEWSARFDYGAWDKQKTELKAALTSKEWDSAKRSTLNAHYTHPSVVAAHWQMAQKLGFDGGKFLEPSAGIGYYMGLMPQDLAAKTIPSAVELDSLTGGMLKLLYPKANVKVQGFEKFAMPNDFYDLVASNVPFGDWGVFDPKYDKHKALIHDYFFLKSIDLAKPGGLLMHVTSTGTMDKKDSAIRKALMDKAELVAAIRFPGQAHKENAGTDVVTDLLILRKKIPGLSEAAAETPREAKPKKQGFTGTTVDSLGRLYHWRDGKRVPGPDWESVVDVPDPDGKDPIPVNKYFADNPEQVLGRLDRSGTMRAKDQKNVSKSDDYDKLLKAAIDRLPANVMRVDVRPEDDTKEVIEDNKAKINGLVHKGGKVYLKENGVLVEQTGITKKDGENIGAQLGVRDARNACIAAQLQGNDATDEREALHTAYDAYVAKYGFLNDKKNAKLMATDPDFANLLALEKYDAKTKKAEKTDIFRKDTVRGTKSVDKVSTISEAVGVSLHETGSLDLKRMADLLGKTEAELGDMLSEGDLAYRDPEAGWKPRDQYLSGNVRQKLLMAKAAAEADPQYQRNADALGNVQPADLDYTEISIRMGAPWVPPSDMAKFAAFLVEASPNQFDMAYHPATGKWEANLAKGAYGRRALDTQKAQDEWSTPRANFIDLFEHAMNGKALVITDAADEGKRVVNKQATDDAAAKIQQIKDAFNGGEEGGKGGGGWLWEDDERRERLHRYYNDNFNNVVPIAYDGSHQTFPGMNPAIELYPHQKNFVWQVVTTGKGLAGHEVGTGKTKTMIAAAMELRRLGLARKPAICCLKTNIEQIVAEARQLYPAAKILSTVGAFDSKNRQKEMAKIATGDYDLLFMTHEHLDQMKMKPETRAEFMQKEMDELESAVISAKQESGGDKDNRVVKELENKKLKLQHSLDEALKETSKDDTLYFEDSGVDQIFVDEFHNFKSLPCYSTLDVKGVPNQRSDRATNMYMRTQWLMQHHGGRGLVAATGTPVSNSMAELYVMQRYLQEKDLEERGVATFDAWANTFGEVKTDMEFTVTGEYKPVSRFKSFVNVPELMQIAHQFLDVQRVDDLNDAKGKPIVKRPERKDTVITAPRTPEMAALMASLVTRAKSLRRDNRKEDNMLKICSDGRKGALDLRLLDPGAKDLPDSKINTAVDNILKIYRNRPGKTQLIFSDVGVHEGRSGFSAYKDVIDKLVEGGIPREEIADFSVLENKAKEDAQAGMRAGTIRIGIGGTQRMGTGVNVQNKVVALHGLDVPWKPSDIEQRDGRAWRQGNELVEEGKPLEVYRYVTKDSLDKMMWQVVGTKKNFIDQTINAKNPSRVIKEEDTEELTPAQLMAAATGDVRVLEKVNLDEEVKKLKNAESRHKREQTRYGDKARQYETRAAILDTGVEKGKKLVESLGLDKPYPPEEFSMEIGDATHTKRPEAEKALETAIADSMARGMKSYEEHAIGKYRGFDIVRKPGKLVMRPPGARSWESGDEFEVAPSLRSIETNVRMIPGNVKEMEGQVTKLRADAEEVKKNIGKVFTKTDELATKTKRLQELELALRNANKEPAADEPDVEEKTKFTRQGEPQRFIRIPDDLI